MSEVQTQHTAQRKYRPEIDGLRAFAVVAVIINHFNKDILPGGYLGVDIFFVISGYVITSSLSGRPSKDFKDFISGFYERRIKRLVPALSIFVLTISIAICLFDPSPGASLITGLTSLFGTSNLYLLKDSTDYFAQSTALNPFTHTWSLGVEEQFYILFPFLIWFSGFGRQTKNGARNLFLAIGALTIASLIAFLYFYPTKQAAAYFLMPSRFWEMAAGCLLFIGFQKRGSVEKLIENVPPLLVMALIVGVMYLPMSLASTSTIAVVALSSVLIASLKKQTAAFKVFTNPKVVYLGLISYSLYLWHWGVLSISRWTIGIHWWSVPFQVALMLGLAVASYRWIETPLRKGNWFGRRWKTLAVGGGILVIISGGVVALGKPLKGVFYLGKKYNVEQYDQLTTKKCPPGSKFNLKKVNDCILNSTNGRSILAVGDSQTGHLLPLLGKLHKINGFGVYFYQSYGIGYPSLIEARNTNQDQDNPRIFKTLYDEMEKHFDHYFSKLRTGDIIILSSRFELRWGRGRPIAESQKNLVFTFYGSNGQVLNKSESYEKWQSLLENLAEESKKRGVRMIIFNSLPSFPNSVKVASSGKQWFNSLNPEIANAGMSRVHLINHSRPIDETINSLRKRHSNVGLFDLFSEICPKSQKTCTPDKHRDQWHLSTRGSLSLYKNLLHLINH